MKTVKSDVIGELVQDPEFEDWWESQEVSLPFFDNNPYKVTFMGFIPEEDPDFVMEADRALTSFLQKSEQDRLGLSQLVYQHCMDFLNEIGYDEADKPLWDIKDATAIWKFVYPHDLYVSRRNRRDKDIYLNLACNCQWEQEHGLQLVFRQGKQLTRISDQDGHLTEADAYDIPDAEDTLLSKFIAD